MSDALVVALGSGGAGAVLARSVSVWLQTRVTDLKLRVSTEKGTIELDAKNARHIETLIARFMTALSGVDDDESS